MEQEQLCLRDDQSSRAGPRWRHASSTSCCSARAAALLVTLMLRGPRRPASNSALTPPASAGPGDAPELLRRRSSKILSEAARSRAGAAVARPGQKEATLCARLCGAPAGRCDARSAAPAPGARAVALAALEDA